MREFPEAWSQPHSLLCYTHCVLLSGKPEPLWGAVGEGETMAVLTVLWPHRIVIVEIEWMTAAHGR